MSVNLIAHGIDDDQNIVSLQLTRFNKGITTSAVVATGDRIRFLVKDFAPIICLVETIIHDYVPPGDDRAANSTASGRFPKLTYSQIEGLIEIGFKDITNH